MAKKRDETAADRFKDRFGWRKVQAPKAWRPRDVGEELCGYYGGRTLRNGSFGQYEVLIIHVPHRGSFTVSGVRAIQLMDAALINKGHPVRIVFRGEELLGNGRMMRQMDLYVAEGDPLSEDELPELREERTQ